MSNVSFSSIFFLLAIGAHFYQTHVNLGPVNCVGTDITADSFSKIIPWNTSSLMSDGLGVDLHYIGFLWNLQIFGKMGGMAIIF